MEPSLNPKVGFRVKGYQTNGAPVRLLVKKPAFSAFVHRYGRETMSVISRDVQRDHPGLLTLKSTEMRHCWMN